MVAALAAASLLLMRSLGVFSSRPLEKAPARVCGLTLLHVLGVLIVYLAIEVAAMAVATSGASAATTQGAETGPATTAAATMGAATMEAGDAGVMAFRIRQYGAVAISRLVLFAMLLFVARTMVVVEDEQDPDVLGIGLRKFPKALLPAVIGAFLLAAPIAVANLGTVVVMELWGKAPAQHQMLMELKSHPPLILTVLLVVTAAILAPLTEEFFFRGFLQTALIQKFPLGGFGQGANLPLHPPTVGRRWMAIVVTSVVFTAIHVQPEFFPTLFVLSLGLGYLYERTGTLWAPILLHAMFNSTSLVATLNGK